MYFSALTVGSLSPKVVAVSSPSSLTLPFATPRNIGPDLPHYGLYKDFHLFLYQQLYCLLFVFTEIFFIAIFC